MRTVIDKKIVNSVPHRDGRGKHGKQSKTSTAKIEAIKNHISSFPHVESHYCRKGSTKKYLQPGLSVMKMVELFNEKRAETNDPPVSYPVYRNVFNRHFNLSFFVPKKDQCDICIGFKNANPKPEELIRNQEDHLRNKERARAKKDELKQAAGQANSKKSVACFDLQQVLNCPHGEVSVFFYKRRLSLYNLTVYDLGSKDVICYMWPETVAERGTCEIGSCVYKYVEGELKKGKNEFYFFSDNCWGQNKSKNTAMMYSHLVRNNPIASITHLFLEKGHTQNENDSVHSVIERRSRRIPIHTPDQWFQTVRVARAKQLYKVVEMKRPDFVDFKPLGSKMKNFNDCTDGSRLDWRNIRVMHFDKDRPHKMMVKVDYDQEYKCIDFLYKCRAQTLPDLGNTTLTTLRVNQVPISNKKYEDLCYLCEKNLVPPEYQKVYLDLPHTEIVQRESVEE